MQSSFYRGLEAAQQALAELRAGQEAAVSAHACADRLAQAAIHDAATDGSPVQCGAGCAHCCRHPVGVTEPEARRLLADLAALPPRDRLRLEGRIRAEAERTKARAWRQLQGLACPLLDDEACALYAARPLPCRGLLSRDRSACADAAAGRPALVPFVEESYLSCLGIGQALDQATGGGGHRELRSALAALLGDAADGAFATARPVGDGDGDATGISASACGAG